MKILFAGSIGRFPVGGHAWIDLQYLLGLRRLGHEVFYFEDAGEESWVYDWDKQEITSDLSYPSRYIQDCLTPFGFGDRWLYRAGQNAVGFPLTSFLDLCAPADLLIVRGAPLSTWRKEYLWPRRRAFVDVDPGFTQMDLSQDKSKYRETVRHCERLFTIGQRFGAEGCTVPLAGLTWVKTCSPVCLEYWPPATEPVEAFSTIMQWRSYREVVYQGRSYGNKDKEFGRFLDLPRQTTQPLRIALTGGDPNLLEAHGWHVDPGWTVSRTPATYQAFIQSSRAEFSVAKQGYVATQCGWFSDRSVCFLASGRPVLTQDTGLRDWLPIGQGLFTFSSVAEALKGIGAINADYDAQRRAARNLAEEFFSADRVLTAFLEAATT